MVQATPVPSATARTGWETEETTAVVRPTLSSATPTGSGSPATQSPTPTETPTPTLPPSPDLIAFETYRDGNAEIYLLDAGDGELANISRHPADDRSPAWSPNGTAIAFESHRDGNWEIYVLELSDGSLRRLTDHPSFDGAPAWSPSGDRIAMECARDGNLEIYIVPATGGEPVRLTNDPAVDYGPVWSPDGQSIAFTSLRDGNKEIYVLPLGGVERNVTQHSADDEDPVWDPGGLTLTFTSWRDVDGDTGNRNAEIYQIGVEGGEAQRLTENPWPDADPARDATGRLVWAAYDPGPAFETYDPHRPGDFHLYRAGIDGPERLTATDWDDRHPAPAPLSAGSVEHLTALLAPIPATVTPLPSLDPGTLVEVVEVPSMLVRGTEQSIWVSELVSPSLVAWQQDVLQASGWDFLHWTRGSWRNIDQLRKREMYEHDYGFLSWHKAGRAVDLDFDFLSPGGVDQMVLVREDLGASTYWRMYLRTAKQDGSQGEPLRDNPWQRWWWIVPELEPEAYEAGGKRLPIPTGTYVDVTAIAKRHGWERIACYAIEDGYDWRSDSNGTEYWHYERTDGLIWWDAMLQLYTEETLDSHVGWEIGLHLAQSEEMMISKGVPTPSP